MYGLAGERRLLEFTLDWLPGYEGAAPVRVGNAAADQLQLDVYGEVLGAAYLARAAAGSLTSRAGPCSSGCWTTWPPRGRSLTRHLGSARATATLHALQGDGLVRFHLLARVVEEFGLPRPRRALA